MSDTRNSGPVIEKIGVSCYTVPTETPESDGTLNWDKMTLDTVQAAVLTRKSWIHYQAFNLYSLVTALSAFLILPFVMPEARTARQKLRGN